MRQFYFPLFRIGLVVAAMVGLVVITSSATAGPPFFVTELARVDGTADQVVMANGVAFAIDNGCEGPIGTPPIWECTGKIMSVSVQPPELGNLGEFSKVDYSFEAFAISGNYGYLVAEYDRKYGTQAEYRLLVLDVSDPANVQQVNEIELPIEFRRLFVLRTRPGALFLGVTKEGLRVYDLSDAVAPVEVAHLFDDGSSVVDLSFEGNLLYTATGGQVQIVDVSDPVNPAVTGNTILYGYGSDEVDVFGDDIFLTANKLCWGDHGQPYKCGEELIQGKLTNGVNFEWIRQVAEGAGFHDVAMLGPIQGRGPFIAAQSGDTAFFNLNVPEGTRAEYVAGFGRSNAMTHFSNGLLIVTTPDSVRLIRFGPAEHTVRLPLSQ